MEVKASARYIRMSPRKVRLVAALVRGKTLAVALDQLKFVGKYAASPVLKAISSAAANATHNFDIKQENLYVKEIRVDMAPTLKRWLPRAQGRATPINKRSSHINVILAEITDGGVRAARKIAVDAPVKLGEVPAKTNGIKVDEKETNKPVEPIEDKEKKIVDPRREGRESHGRSEGGKKGFTSKIFNRKSG